MEEEQVEEEQVVEEVVVMVEEDDDEEEVMVVEEEEEEAPLEALPEQAQPRSPLEALRQQQGMAAAPQEARRATESMRGPRAGSETQSPTTRSATYRTSRQPWMRGGCYGIRCSAAPPHHSTRTIASVVRWVRAFRRR